MAENGINVTFHGRDGAAVNVKLHNWRELSAEELEAEAAAAENECPPGTRREFAAWYKALDDDAAKAWADLAIRDGWDQLRRECRSIFGESADVFSAGRSGGWAIAAPDGRNGFTPEDCREWTPEDWQKWEAWRQSCREVCADLPRSAAWLAFASEFAPMIEAREESRRFSFWYDVPGEV